MKESIPSIPPKSEPAPNPPALVYADVVDRFWSGIIDFVIFLAWVAVMWILLNVLKIDLLKKLSPDLFFPVAFFLALLWNFILNVFFLCSPWQATPGMRLTKLKLMNRSGDRIRLSNIFWRGIYSFVPGAPTLWQSIFYDINQWPQDILSGTYVCRIGPPDDDPGDDPQSRIKPLKYDE